MNKFETITAIIILYLIITKAFWLFEFIVCFYVFFALFRFIFDNKKKFVCFKDIFLTYCKNNKKIIVVSLCLSIIFTILTPHWWVKTNYWINKIKVGSPLYYQIQIKDKTNLTTSHHRNFKYLSDCPSFLWLVTVEKKKNYDNITYLLEYIIQPQEKEFKSSFYVNTKKDLEIIIPIESTETTSFKINDIEYIKKFDKDGKLTLRNLYGKKVNISCKAKLKVKSANFLDNISYTNLFASLFFYFLITNIVIFKKDKIKLFLSNTTKHKTDITLFILFFIIYLLLNHYAVYHTEYTGEFSVYLNSEDTMSRVREILLSTIMRFHSYWFLPFYPLFDTLFFLTKNITLILMVLFSMITSFTVVLVNNILRKINPEMKYINLILTLIFGFAYTVTTSYYSFEVYPVTAFYLALLVLLIINELKTKGYNSLNLFFISLITALTFGVTIQNIITSLILILAIFLVKKQPKQILKYSLFVIIFISLFLNLATNVSNANAWDASNVFKQNGDIKMWTTEKKYGYFIQTFQKPLLAQDKNYSKIVINAFLVVFTTLILLSLILLPKSKIKKEDKILFILSLLALIYNFAAIYYWSPQEGFLFAPNHFTLWFIVFAYCLKIVDEELKKHKLTINNNIFVAILVLFLFIEIPTNYIANKNAQNIPMERYPLTSPIIEMVK